MKIAKLGFPEKISARRRYFARHDTCPECGHELDTGFECKNCRYDAMKEAEAPQEQINAERRFQRNE